MADVSRESQYERDRRKRIERNKHKLAELGLLTIPDEPLVPRPAPKPKRSPRQPSRQSQRLRGVTASEPAPIPVKMVCARRAEHGGMPASFAELNLHRLRTMSDQSLQRRIWKIKRVVKLQSFITVLQAGGKTELAVEAQEALDQLLQNGPAI